MTDIRALVAAAGKGTRAGLSYPKTLFPLQGRPILLRILDVLEPFDGCPTVIVSPDGASHVQTTLNAHQRGAHILVQSSPRGMGDAVLQFEKSPAFQNATDILLVWGDIPFIQPSTVDAVVKTHCHHENDFTFATRVVDSPYTVVFRDDMGRVTKVVETREAEITPPRHGERDIGLFLFRKSAVLTMLRSELPGKWGKTTGEQGFLYVIEHLAARGMKVEALPVATELDLVSLNSLKDVDGFL